MSTFLKLRAISGCNVPLLGALLISLAGCGGESGQKAETLVAASGSVKLNGMPAEGVRLAFYPSGENKAVGGCWAVTDNLGNFKVMHVSSKEGIPPGVYHVTFSRFVKPDGTLLPPGQSPTMTPSSESIAPMWSDLSKAHMHNQVEIPAKGTDNLSFSVSTVPQQ